MNTRSGFLKRLGLPTLETGQRATGVLDVRSAHAPAAEPKDDAAPAESDVDDAESTAKQWAEAEKAEAAKADARN